MNRIKVKDYVAINIVTSGLDENKDEIIYLSAQKVVDDNLLFNWYSFVKPKKPIRKAVLDILNLSNAERELLSNARKIEDVIDDFLDYIKDNVIVGYNLDFDLKFINKYLEENNKPTINCGIDMLDLAKEKLFNTPNYSLTNVCKALKLGAVKNIIEETRQMAEMYKILRDKKYNAVFLDIDGVINNEDTKTTFNPYLRIDNKLVQKLAHIVYQTNSAIFLVSDWKEYWEKDNKEKQDDCANFLDYMLSCEHLKITDKVAGPTCERGANIKRFLSENEDIGNFVILDDIEFDYKQEGYGDNYIQTDSAKGLTDEDVEQAINILNKN